MSKARLEQPLDRAHRETFERTVSDLITRVSRLEREVFGFKKIGQTSETEISNKDPLSQLTNIRQLKSTLAMSLAILNHFFKTDPNHTGLSPDQIVSILREKFAVPVPLPSVSSALYRATGSLVTRERLQGTPVKYRYRILPKGQEFLSRNSAY